jgi:hypothetical protein
VYNDRRMNVMATITPLDEAEAAYREHRPPRFACGDAATWHFAVLRLLDSGKLNIAEHALRHLRAAFPALVFARNLCEMLDRMPRLEAAQATFKDDPSKDVQVVAQNSELVALLFCGDRQALGLPLPMIHAWLAQLPASLVYLRDFRRVFFLHGVQSLGPTRDATLTALRRIITSLHGQRIICYGNSGGIFGALDYGLELGAEKVLCMAGPTNLVPASNIHTTYKAKALALKSQFPNACLDMRAAYSRAVNPPSVCIVYGNNSWDDRIQAERMSTLSCVTLYGIKDSGAHNVIIDVIRRGEYEDFLDWLVRPPEENSFPRAATVTTR